MANAYDFINRCLDMVKVLIMLPEDTRIISAKLPETGIDYFTLHLRLFPNLSLQRSCQVNCKFLNSAISMFLAIKNSRAWQCRRT